ncbi:MAG: DUF2892 domain-containing protein [Vicinamibacterales bacterium]
MSTADTTGVQMHKNMGMGDRVIRTALAVVIIALYMGGQISGTVAVLLGIVAAAFVLTSLVSWCPAYVPFGFSTRKR